MAGWFYVLQSHNNSGRFKVGWTGEERLEKRIGEHRTIMPDLILRAVHHCANQQQEQACIKHLATQSYCQQVNSSEVFEVKSVESFLQAINAYFDPTEDTKYADEMQVRYNEMQARWKALFRQLSNAPDLMFEQQVQLVRDAVANQQAIQNVSVEELAQYLKRYDSSLESHSVPPHVTTEAKTDYLEYRRQQKDYLEYKRQVKEDL
jgi:hypothetical protein